jgi:threonine dehydrogenase-like Zn-dependent dehydrogenase
MLFDAVVDDGNAVSGHEVCRNVARAGEVSSVVPKPGDIVVLLN